MAQRSIDFICFAGNPRVRTSGNRKVYSEQSESARGICGRSVLSAWIWDEFRLASRRQEEAQLPSQFSGLRGNRFLWRTSAFVFKWQCWTQIAQHSCRICLPSEWSGWRSDTSRLFGYFGTNHHKCIQW